MNRLLAKLQLLMGVLFFSGSIALAATRLTVDDGLSSNTILSIGSMSNGTMVVSTNNGVQYYDGYSFSSPITMAKGMDDFRVPVYYNAVLPLNSKYIALIDRTRELTFFNNYTRGFEDNSISQLFANKRVHCVVADSKAGIWGGCTDTLFYLPRGGTDLKNIVLSLKKKRGVRIQTIFESDCGLIWVGTWEDGVYIVDPDNWSFRQLDVLYVQNKGGVENTVSAIVQDGNGKMWLGTWGGGFCRVDSLGESGASLTWFSSLGNGVVNSKQVKSAAVDKEGNLLFLGPGGLDVVSTFDRQVKINDCQRYVPYLNGHYSCSFVDGENTVWLGTSGQGVVKLPKENISKGFISIEKGAMGLSAENVRCIYSYDESHLLAGVQNSGFLFLNPDNNTGNHFSQVVKRGQELLRPLNAVTAFHKDEKGNLWMGTRYQGLHIFKDWEPIGRDGESAVGIKNRLINNICSDKEGGVWVAGRYNLFRTKLGNGGLGRIPMSRHSNISFNINRIEITDLFCDKAGNLWVTSLEHGLFLLKSENIKAEKWEFIHVNKQYPQFNLPFCIYDIEQSPDGNYWLASNRDGLIKWKYFKQAEPIVVNNGVKLEAVYALEYDSLGYLWMSSNVGIARLGVGGADSTFFYWDRTDGIRDQTFFPNSSCLLNDGRVCFGGYKGVHIFDSRSLRSDSIPPKAIINRIVVQDSTYYFPVDGKAVLELGSQTKEVRIYFACNSYANPEKNRFKYRLKGYDSGWRSNSGEQTMVVYANLPKGSYQFELLCCSSSYVWSPVPVQLGFTVLPALWQTWWAKAVYIIVGVVLLVLLIHFSIKRNRLRQINEYNKDEYEHSRESFANLGAGFPKAEALLEADKVFLIRLEEVLENNYRDPGFNVNRLENMLVMSKSSVFLKVTTLTGMSSNELIRSFRLSKSLDFLKQGETTIAEVAYACGFNDPGYYTRCFKSRYGVTPKAYSSE